MIMDDKRFDDRESIQDINEYLQFLDKMKKQVDKMLNKEVSDEEE